MRPLACPCSFNEAGALMAPETPLAHSHLPERHCFNEAGALMAPETQKPSSGGTLPRCFNEAGALMAPETSSDRQKVSRPPLLQ